jgi:hypothetical protein
MSSYAEDIRRTDVSVVYASTWRIPDKATENDIMSEPMSPFSDPQAVARYTEGPPRIVPGYDGLLRMTTLLLAERVPEDARVLVLGAGGGWS